jgi:hypothetical protein
MRDVLNYCALRMHALITSREVVQYSSTSQRRHRVLSETDMLRPVGRFAQRRNPHVGE